MRRDDTGYDGPQTVHDTGDDTTRLDGTIARLIPDKGFGFIQVIDPQRGARDDYFFHAQDLDGGVGWAELVIGDAVTFRAETSTKGNGKRARAVRVVA